MWKLKEIFKQDDLLVLQQVEPRPDQLLQTDAATVKR